MRTYSHLSTLGRVPSDYDVATSKLLYHPERGFEVVTPVGDFHLHHQGGSRLQLADAELFRDPRETTYARWVELQDRQEIFVDGLYALLDDGAYDRGLDPAWMATLAQLCGVLRFPVHGLQMVAAHVGSLAPAGRLVITCALQAGDEMRRIQRLAYRLRVLQNSYPDAGADARARWQDNPMWQPLRRVVERLLVTYDWGESFAALALVVKPAFDELFLAGFGARAAAAGDDVLAKLFASLGEDARWHRAWTGALVDRLVDPAGATATTNAAALAEWRARWQPDTHAAMAALAPLYGAGPGAAVPFDDVLARVRGATAELLP